MLVVIQKINFPLQVISLEISIIELNCPNFHQLLYLKSLVSN